MMETKEFDQILEKYAELIVKAGLNLQPDQQLIIWAGPLDVSPLVRKVVQQAYHNQSRFVSVLWLDEEVKKIRLQHAPKDSFEESDSWKLKGILECIEEGAAYLQVWGNDPDAFKDIKSEILGTVNRVRSENYRPISIHQGRETVQWCLVCPPTLKWAQRVFPEEKPDRALKKLWDAVTMTCRLDQADPINYWTEYQIVINQRARLLTEKAYQSLKFTGPSTDLSVGLPPDHIWEGGGGHTVSGLPYIANLPTEEVFTLPHRNRVNGKVTATKPLSYRGMFINHFWLEFSEGKVVDFGAEVGEDKLGTILDTDPNARFLGEVALVPHQTPISQSGILFLNTLYDENASNHLALGSAYFSSLKGGGEMTMEEFAQAGGNDSLIHVDFMFGSGEMDVDGVLPDGSTESVMRGGEWAFNF
jgi:aminopeptidase